MAPSRCQCAGLVGPLGSSDGSGGRRGVASGDGDEGRSEDAVAEPVAAPDLLDDRALGLAGPGHVDDGVVLSWIERPAGSGVDRAHALALEELAELAVDRRDALRPGVARVRLRVGPRWPGRGRRRGRGPSRSGLRAARPSIASRSSAVRRLKFWNSARSRCSPARYSSALAWLSPSSAVRRSMSARSLEGLMSRSSMRSCARVR